MQSLRRFSIREYKVPSSLRFEGVGGGLWGFQVLSDAAC